MLLHLLFQIIDWIFSFFTLALLARVVLQAARAPARNPLSQFVIAVTDWAVVPARRTIPSAFGIDLPTLILAWITQAIFHSLVFGLFVPTASLDPATVMGIALFAALATLRLAVYLLIGAVIISALLSWINPYAPLAPLVGAITRPFLQPLQRVIPPIGGIDLSPLALLLALQIILSLLTWMQQLALPLSPL